MTHQRHIIFESQVSRAKTTKRLRDTAQWTQSSLWPPGPLYIHLNKRTGAFHRHRSAATAAGIERITSSSAVQRYSHYATKASVINVCCNTMHMETISLLNWHLSLRGCPTLSHPPASITHKTSMFAYLYDTGTIVGTCIVVTQLQEMELW